MTRSVTLPAADHFPVPTGAVEELTEPEDDAALSQSYQAQTVISNQYVVYSSTFQVPTFYFTVHDLRASVSLVSVTMTLNYLRQMARLCPLAISSRLHCFDTLRWRTHPSHPLQCRGLAHPFRFSRKGIIRLLELHAGISTLVRHQQLSVSLWLRSRPVSIPRNGLKSNCFESWTYGSWS